MDLVMYYRCEPSNFGVWLFQAVLARLGFGERRFESW